MLAQVNCGFVTYTQGGYGSPAHGSNPGTLVQTRFASAFPSGLVIGCTGAGGHTLTLTTAAAVTAFLPSGSNPGALTQNYINPGHSYSSEFAGQLASLTLSVHFSSTNLGGAVITTGTFAGLTVNQLLVIANNVYGGCSTQYTLSQLNTILTAINEAYDEGHVSTLLSCCTVALGTPSITNVGCTGGSTGSFTIAATGGSGFMYALATVTGGTVGTYGTAQASGTFSNLAAGTYSVRVTAANGCTAVRQLTISQPLVSLGITTAAATNSSCTAAGSITVTATGGTAPYTYQLGSGSFGTSNVFTGLAPGTYTVTVRDASGCSVTRTNVSVLGVPGSNIVLALSNVVNATCTNNGSATLSATGGTAPYTFTLTNGATVLTSSTGAFTGLLPGTYQVLVRDANGCTATCAAIQITGTAAVIALTPTVTPANCFGTATGRVQLVATGGTAPYTFTFDGRPTNTTGLFVDVAAGTYPISVRDANGCTATGTVNVTQPAAIALTLSNVVNATCTTTGSATLGASGGTAPYTFRLTSGSTVFTNTTGVFTGLGAGLYQVLVTDARGCTATCAAIQINTSPPITLLSSTQVNVTCFGAANGSVRLTATGGTAPFTFTLDGLPTNTTGIFTGLAPGTYPISVRDANGCTATGTAVIITQPAAITLTLSNLANATCSASNGTATLTATGGTAPFTYTLTSGATVISNTTGIFSGLAAGTYQVLVTDARGCTATCAAIQINSTPAITSLTSTQLVNVNCFGTATGRVQLVAVGGTAPFTFTLGSRTPNSTGLFVDLAAGTYAASVRDANGCTASAVVVITQPVAALSLATASVVNATCSASNGSITLAATGGTAPYTYALDGLPTNSTGVFAGLPAGVYPASVTDARGCTFVLGNVTILGTPAIISLGSSQQVNVSCFGTATGSVRLTAVGGTAPYTYTLDALPSNTTGIFTGLAAGTYTTSVRDANGCIATGASVVITQPAALTGTFTATGIRCFGGSATLTGAITGGTPPYQVSVNGAQFVPAPVASGSISLPAGSYSVVVRDANLCTVSSQIVITQPAQVVASANTPVINCFGGTTTLTASAVGGTGAYQFSFNGDAFDGPSRVVGAGTYSIVARDANGCLSAAVTRVVAQPAALVVTLSNLVNGTCTTATGSATLSASGGTAPYVYQLSMGSTVVTSTTGIFTGLAAGTYAVLVTDARGCTATCAAIQINSIFANIVLTSTQTNVNCFGTNTGSFTVTATGGAAPYQYSVNGSAFGSSNTFSGLIAGTYNATARDINGCLGTTTVTITQPLTALAIATAVPSNAICTAANGSITVTATGGAGGFQYAINGGAFGSSNVFTGLAAGNYTVSVRDASACVVTSSTVTILGAPSPIVLTSVVTPVRCFGEANGSVQLAASGGAGPYVFTLDGRPSNSTGLFTGLAAGTYPISVTGAFGCVATGSVVISQPAQLVVTLSNLVNGTCTTATGSAQLTATGGTGPYTYTLTAGSTVITNTTGIFSGLAAGTYAVLVTDARGCTATCAAIQINSIFANIVVTTTQQNVTCFGTATGNFVISATGGTAPYQYSVNGTPFAEFNGFRNLLAGFYIVTVRDANGCLGNTSVTITQPLTALAITTVVPTNAICIAANGSITVTATGGTAPYQYSLNGAAFVPGNVFTGLAAGTYTVTVRDANGCIVTQSGVSILGSPSALVLASAVTPVRCFGEANGSVQLAASGGAGPYVFTLDGRPSNSTGLFTGLAAGTYPVSVTGAFGCVATGSVVISQPAQLVVTLSNLVNANCTAATGSAQLTATGGTGPYTYTLTNGATVISNTTGIFSGLVAGTYAVLVTDARGCTATCAAIQILGVPSIIALTPSVLNATCFGTATGRVQLTAVGGTAPYTFTFDGRASNSTGLFTDVAAGTYPILVRDANGCTASGTVVVGQPTQVVLANAVTNVTCFGANNGRVQLSATGGTGAYTFTLDGVSNASGLFIGLAPGTYPIAVRDANGCVATGSVAITQPAQLVVTLSNLVNGTCTTATGSAQLTATGGTGPYTYTLTSGSTVITNTTGIFTGLAAGTYAVLVTDARGCTATCAAIQINSIFANIVLTSTQVNVNCTGLNTGSFAITATGGTAPYSYSVNGGGFGSGNIFSNLVAGTYNVIVRDANGCTATRQIVITQPVIVLGIPTVDVINATCIGANGSITVNAAGGQGGYTYALDNGGFGTSNVFSGLAAGTYTVSVRDAGNCTVTRSNVAILGTPSTIVLASAVVSPVRCFGEANGSVQLTATGTGPFTFTLDGRPSNSTGLFTGLAAGTYPISVTGAFGCTATGSVTIAQPAPIVLTLSNLVNATCTTATGSAQLTATGGTAPFTYQLTNGSLVLTNSTGIFSGLAAGTYQVLVTDARGCTATCAAIEIRSIFANILVTSTQVNVSCFGANTGNFIVSATGGTAPYLVSVNGGAFGSANVFANLTAGTYNVTVRDANGCLGTTAVTILQPLAPVAIVASVSNAICTAANGSITVTATGGVGGYQFSLDGYSFSSSSVFAGLAPGTYTVTARDANGCIARANVTILGTPSPIVLTNAVTNVSCFGSNNGSVQLSATGTGPFVFTLTGRPSNGTGLFTGLAPGTYTASVTGAFGCTATTTVVISQPAVLGVTLSNLVNANCTTATGSAQLTATGGTGPYTYSLTMGSTVLTNNTGIFTGLAPGVYNVLVVDARGCTATCAAIQINSTFASIALTSTQVNVSCFGGNTGSFVITATGGTAPYSYQLGSGAFGSSNTFSNLTAGTYNVTVRDANGCTATRQVVITQPTQLVLSSTATNVTCFGANNGQVQLTATGGTGAYTFTLDGASNATGLFIGLAPGTYAIAVRDANNCTATATSVSITQPASALSVVFSATVNACSGTAGQASVSAVGGTAPYTYQLRVASTGVVVATSPVTSGSYNFTGLAANTYRLFVTDARGCTKECTTQLLITNACSSFSSTGSNGSSTANSADQIVVYPNPFKEKATVEFRVAEGEHYSLAIYDMVGRVVSRVAEGTGEANHTYQVVVGQGLEEGIYMMRLTLGNKVKSVRLHVQK
ncbi:hypothetical protein AUC43_17920 [Hymenobacter sedentarius]|uniref:Secretion system C-terminal sorting domain-containing protein n=1 Tax=Hymenobacter sedentarius TaxID=1411621 RepID=A0A0U4C911_9BACT|nr:hypothetical protein AUC43_17920 [Hymenobacter sedentarius]